MLDLFDVTILDALRFAVVLIIACGALAFGAIMLAVGIGAARHIIQSK